MAAESSPWESLDPGESLVSPKQHSGYSGYCAHGYQGLDLLHTDFYLQDGVTLGSTDPDRPKDEEQGSEPKLASSPGHPSSLCVTAHTSHHNIETLTLQNLRKPDLNTSHKTHSPPLRQIQNLKLSWIKETKQEGKLCKFLRFNSLHMVKTKSN